MPASRIFGNASKTQLRLHSLPAAEISYAFYHSAHHSSRAPSAALMTRRKEPAADIKTTMPHAGALAIASITPERCRCPPIDDTHDSIDFRRPIFKFR